MNKKTGLDYFPFDVDFFEDEKIQFISAKFGVVGEMVAIRLLTRIYRNGYYLPWGEDETLLFAKRIGDPITPELIDDIIKELLKRKFLSIEKYEKYGILTSPGIQRRFFEAVKRRKVITAVKDFLLVDISGQNVNILDENVDILPQRKGKERKEENIGANAPIGGDESPPDTPPAPENPENECPQKQIIALYHKILPELPRVKVWSKRNASFLRARWKQKDEYQCLEWWADFFYDDVKASDFLTGKTSHGFVADLEWLVTAGNFTKILNGRFKNRGNGNPMKGVVSEKTKRTIENMQEWIDEE